jgi:hypothetical protein
MYPLKPPQSTLAGKQPKETAAPIPTSCRKSVNSFEEDGTEPQLGASKKEKPSCPKALPQIQLTPAIHTKNPPPPNWEIMWEGDTPAKVSQKSNRPSHHHPTRVSESTRNHFFLNNAITMSMFNSIICLNRPHLFNILSPAVYKLVNTLKKKMYG